VQVAFHQNQMAVLKQNVETRIPYGLVFVANGGHKHGGHLRRQNAHSCRSGFAVFVRILAGSIQFVIVMSVLNRGHF